MESRSGFSKLVALAGCLLTLGLPNLASATFPGSNGKIAYVRDNQIWTMNADGSGQTQLTSEADGAANPAWSADGRRIAFERPTGGAVYGAPSAAVYVINADGSGRLQVASGAGARDPAWSPDGSKLAYVKSQEYYDVDGGSHIRGFLHTVKPDGTGDVTLFQNEVSNPRWSPDGTRIAMTGDTEYSGSPNLWVTGPGGWATNTYNDYFIDWRPNGARILGGSIYNPSGVYTVDATDGSDRTPIPSGVAGGWLSWSPDGRKFIGQAGDIFTWNTDGTGQTNLTNTPGVTESQPAWQPITTNYVRPKGASPFQTYLVPAYNSCAAPNRTHGSPLAFPSCSPPSRSSSLALGTPDANGQPPNGLASVFLATRVGDLKVVVTIRDVRKADLSDYTGQLDVQTDLRITDRNNTPSPGPATVTDSPLHVPVSCTATGSATLGSDCNATTTVNSLYPGAISAGQRAVWEVGQVKAYDGGADGVASTTGDNTLFLTQGIFIP